MTGSFLLHGISQPSAAAPAQPVHTEWGTGDSDGGTQTTVEDVALTAGDLLIVFGDAFGIDGPPGPGIVTWNGFPLALRATIPGTFVCAEHSLFDLIAPVTASGTVVFTSVMSDGVVLTVSSWHNLSGVPDRQAAAEGNDANPTVTTLATTQANEILVAAVCQPDALSPLRAWNNGISAGQNIQTGSPGATVCDPVAGFRLNDGYKQLAAMGVQTASKSGGAATRWLMLAATYKI